jgi:drug/metabolite transporter (DMT)-like permease
MKMKPLFWVGAVLLIAGILSFVVPIPQSETHGVKVGDASVGVTTKSEHKLSPVVGGVLCAVGAVLMVAGARK